jgi:hypothetical protein
MINPQDHSKSDMSPSNQRPVQQTFLVSDVHDGKPRSTIVVGSSSRQHAVSMFMVRHPDAEPIAAVSLAELEETVELLKKAGVSNASTVGGLEIIDAVR